MPKLPSRDSLEKAMKLYFRKDSALIQPLVLMSPSWDNEVIDSVYKIMTLLCNWFSVVMYCWLSSLA